MVDEKLVTFRARCPFCQYIPSKPVRQGIKLWAICDSIRTYAWKLETYLGKQGQQRNKNQQKKVVKRMVEEFENSGRNIPCDNFIRSYSLSIYDQKT